MKVNVLNVLEVRIVEYCNYHCVACGAFSNIAKGEEYGVEQYEKDLTRMDELFDEIKLFRIYGGEPFASRKLGEYATIARKILKNSKIEIVTNGSLIHKASEELLQQIKDLNIKIVISYYDAENELVNQGIERIDQNKMDYELIPTRHFYAIQDFTTKHDPVLSRKMCVVSIASYLHNAKLYACPYPFSYVHYDRKYGTSYSNIEDGIDIYDPVNTAELIIKRLNEPMKFCENCVSVPQYVKWEQNTPAQTDWFSGECNNRIDEGYTWYDFLVDVNKLNYIVISIQGEKIEYSLIPEKELNIETNKVVLLEDYYSRLLYESTFVHTAKKLKLKYDVLDYEKDGINQLDEYYQLYEKKLDVILFSSLIDNRLHFVKIIKKRLAVLNK